MILKLKKVDRRMTGYGQFTHIIEFDKKSSLKFAEIREWCWEQWGPSREYELWSVTDPTEQNTNYCWISDQWRFRLYLNAQAAAWLSLKWVS
jgi:hypothetical protein